MVTGTKHVEHVRLHGVRQVFSHGVDESGPVLLAQLAIDKAVCNLHQKRHHFGEHGSELSVLAGAKTFPLHANPGFLGDLPDIKTNHTRPVLNGLGTAGVPLGVHAYRHALSRITSRSKRGMIDHRNPSGIQNTQCAMTRYTLWRCGLGGRPAPGLSECRQDHSINAGRSLHA